MEPGSACPHPCGRPPSCAGGRILNPFGSRSKDKLPHRGGASDSETDRVACLTAPEGGSDEDQNGFFEAEILDSMDVIERMDFPSWFLTVIATLDGFNDMDSVEVFRWQRDEFEECG